jgi:hypothetical protein
MENDAEGVIAGPFSDEELLLAFRIILSDEEAHQELEELRRTQNRRKQAFQEYRQNAMADTRERGLLPGEAQAFSVHLGRDILVVLSLLSDNLATRVRQYSEWLYDEDISVDGDWKDRRDELRTVVQARLRQLGRT